MNIQHIQNDNNNKLTGTLNLFDNINFLNSNSNLEILKSL